MARYRIQDSVRTGNVPQFRDVDASLIQTYIGQELPDCTSQSGQCLDFNGIDNYVSVAITDSVARFNGKSYLTFGCRLYHRGSAASQRILTHSSGYPCYVDIKTNNKLTLVMATVPDGGGDAVSKVIDFNNSTVTANAWHDIRIVVNCVESKVRVYIDGQLTDELWPTEWTGSNRTVYSTGTSTPRIGSSGAGTTWVNGMLSYVYLTPEALGDSIHTSIVYRGQGATPDASGWVMPLNEANPTSVGTNQWRLFEGRGVIQATLYAQNTSFINGRFSAGGAQRTRSGIATVLGPEHWGNIKLTTPTIGTSDFSLGVWARLPSSATNSVNYIMSAFGDNGNYLVIYAVRSNATVRVNYSLGGTTGSRVVSGFTLGVWNHIAVTFDRDGNMIVYLNGEAGDTSAFSGRNLALLTGPWYIGTTAAQHNFSNAIRVAGFGFSNLLWTEANVLAVKNLTKRN